MIKVEDVPRKNGIPDSVTISVGNVTMTFRRHSTERKLIRTNITHNARVYDRHNSYIPKVLYTKVIKIAYAILYTKPKEVKVDNQLQLGLNL